MSKEKIVVIDDEADIAELVRYNLAKEGYEVVVAGSGEDGLARVRTYRPALVVLDLMLPGIDGLDVCRSIKSDSALKHVSVVMLTAKGDEVDIVTGLELGADDYLIKPFSPRVLLARVKAILRRNKEGPKDGEAKLCIEQLEIDPLRHEVHLDGTLLDLTRTEFKILHFLARQRGWVYTRDQIVDSVHGEDYPVTDRSIDVQIVGLRKKLGSFGKNIETVRGVGYKFKDAT